MPLRKLRVKHTRVSRMLTVFLVSIIFVSASLLSVIAVLHFHRNMVDRENQSLDINTGRIGSDLAGLLDQLRRDVRFLSQLPSVQAYIAASVNRTGSSEPEVQAEEASSGYLTSVLTQFSQLNPDFAQIRLIGTADHGREVIRINQTREAGVTVVLPADLQEKGTAAYFQEAIGLPVGDVYISPIELNREFAQISQPPEPVLIVASALQNPDGSPFGIMVINFSMSAMFSRYRNMMLPDQQLYLIDENGEFLIHPDPDRIFAFDFNRSYTFTDEFNFALDTLVGATGSLDIPGGPAKNSRLAYQKIYPRSEDPARYYTAVITTDKKGVVQITADLALNLAIVVLMVTALGGVVVNYLSRPVRARIERFELAVEQAPSGIAIADAEGDLQYANAGFQEFTGFDAGELESRNLRETILSHLGSIQLTGLRNSVASCKRWQTEFSKPGEQGYRNWFALDIQPVLDERDKLSYQLVQIHDITSLKQIDLLQQQHDVAVESDRAKVRFLSHMSHELRTPLNAIIGFSELEIENLNGNRADYSSSLDHLREIHLAGLHLLELVNEVLDFARLQSGERELEKSEFQVNPFLNEIVEQVKPIALNKGLVFELDIPPELGKKFTDASMLRRVLLSLLSNAVKFTDKGTVALNVLVQKDQGAEKLVFKVSDTGIGIHDSQKGLIFDAFYQKDQSEMRGYGGTGLGLTNARKFAELLGGNLSFQSRPGAGSVFQLVVPRRLT